MAKIIECELCGDLLEDHYYRVRIVYDTSNGRRLILEKLRVCDKCLRRLKEEYRGSVAKVRYRKVKISKPWIEKNTSSGEEACHDPRPNHPWRIYFEKLLRVYDEIGQRLLYLAARIRENPEDNRLRVEFNRLWKKRKRLAVELLSAAYYAPCNLRHRVKDIKEFYLRTSKKKWLENT